MDSGRLREVVIVEEPIETANELGETTQTWNPIARRRAAIEAVGYIEANRRDQIGGEISHTVTIRYMPALKANMRMRWESRGDRILNISGIVERGIREWHEITAEERN